MYSDRKPSKNKRQQQYDDKWKHDLYDNNEEPQVSHDIRSGDKILQSKPDHNQLYGPDVKDAYDLQRTFCRDRVRQYDVVNESNKRKRETQQLGERGTKHSQEENAGYGSVWEDRKRTMLARNKSSTESCTFANSEREQDMNQQKGVQTKINVLEIKRQSREESKAEDFPHQVVSQSNFAITPGEASMAIQMQGEGVLHLKKENISHDTPDIMARSSRSLSEGAECDSKNQIQPHYSKALDCDESNQKKKVHPPVLEWRFQLVMPMDSSEDTQSQTCSGEDAIEVQTECPLKETVTNTLINTEDEQSLSLRSTESLSLANKDDIDSHAEGILEDSNSLFEQARYLWETPDAIEVFRSIPQQPHFRPLAEMNECLRVGYVVGTIVSFVSVVQKVRKLQLNDPNSDFIETLNVLEKFEVVGFDVQRLRSRLDKLVSIKTATEELDVELEKVEEQIIEEKLEEDLLESMVRDFDEKLKALEETCIAVKQKREENLMKKLAKDSNITELERSIQDSEAELQSFSLRFTHLAGSPWGDGSSLC